MRIVLAVAIAFCALALVLHCARCIVRRKAARKLEKRCLDMLVRRFNQISPARRP